MVSYFLLLEKEGLCANCQLFDSKAPSKAPEINISGSQLLEERHRFPRSSQSAQVLLHSLSTCSSVQKCSKAWSYLAILFRPRAGVVKDQNHPLTITWKALSDWVTEKLLSLRQLELEEFRREALKTLMSESFQFSERSSVLLLSADQSSYFQRENVWPFIRQLRCYAQRRQMRFVLDGGPWPSYWNMARQEPYTWTLQWTESAPSLAEELQLRSLLQDLLQHGKLQRAKELLGWEQLNVFSEDPNKMTKIWSIERQLDSNATLVVYLDTDVVIRPDSLRFDLGLVPLLHSSPNRSRFNRVRSDIFVRDSPSGTECVNIGFFALRNTRITRMFLELWRQKSVWSTFWDQSAFAETLLELVGMEMGQLGQAGYKSQCLGFLLPARFGEVPYTAYCDCWQQALREMIGPYRQRRSRLVKFVDPEELDINFVPNDFFWDHGFTLEGMHLVKSRKVNEIMNPLIIHWAGVGNQDIRLQFAKQYLKQRFNTSFDQGTCSRLPKLVPPARFNSRGRLVRCCKNLQRQQERRNLVDYRDICYWGCCEWKPIRAADCRSLFARGKKGGTIAIPNEHHDVEQYRTLEEFAIEKHLKNLGILDSSHKYFCIIRQPASGVARE